MNDQSNSKNPSDKQKTKKEHTPARKPRAFSFWVMTPLLSFIVFILFFYYCSNRVGLGKFQWSDVETNIALRITENKTPMPGLDQVAAPKKQVREGRSPAEVPKFSTGNAGVNDNDEDQLKPSKENGGKESQPISQVTKELSARLFWAVSALIFGFLCFLVICQVVRMAIDWLTQDEWSGCKAKCVLLCKIGLVILVTFGTVLSYNLCDGEVTNIAGGNAGELLLKGVESTNNPVHVAGFVRTNEPSIMSEVSNKSSQPFLYPPSAERKHSLPDVRKIVSWLAALSRSGVIAVALAACVILYQMKLLRIRFENTERKAEDTQKLVDQYEALVAASISLLQLTACTLVAGVFEVYLLYFLTSFHMSPVLEADVRYYGQTLAITAGAVYTGMLVAVYLPLMSGQREMGRELLQKHRANIDVPKTTFLAQLDDPDISKLPMVKNALTVLSPVLAALAAKLALTVTEYFL